MAVTPRRDEVAGVVALLESDEFDTSTSMAKEIVKLVASVLSVRTTHGVAVGMPGMPPALAIGPFYDKRSAQACLKAAREAGLEARVHRLSGTGSIKAAQALRQVCVCGHRTELHVFAVCAAAGCACQALTLEENL